MILFLAGVGGNERFVNARGAREGWKGGGEDERGGKEEREGKVVEGGMIGEGLGGR